MTETGWDIIGDVHGHCVKLEMLLTSLGYRRTNGTWRHPHGRKACYLGDLIDRGPDQIRTLELVRGMVEANEACCVMGNHEYNAIQYHMGYRTLKEFDDPHEAFLKEAPKGSPAYREWVDWFRNLPLWLDLKEFRVIHACWDPTAMSVLRKKGLGEHAVADESLLKQAGEFWMDRSKDSTIFHAFETLLKGIEISLPEGVTFKDKDGWLRHNIRTRWWMGDANTYRDIAFMSDISSIPDSPIPREKRPEGVHLEKPVFIGHYWQEPTAAKEPLSPKVACLDYSAGKGGPLAAYRWNSGDTVLFPERFAWV